MEAPVARAERAAMPTTAMQQHLALAAEYFRRFIRVIGQGGRGGNGGAGGQAENGIGEIGIGGNASGGGIINDCQIEPDQFHNLRKNEKELAAA